MREAGAPSTGGVASVLSGVCPPHLGYSCSHYPRSRATLAKLGRKAKAAPKAKNGATRARARGLRASGRGRAREKPGRSWEGESQRAPGSTITRLYYEVSEARTQNERFFT